MLIAHTETKNIRNRVIALKIVTASAVTSGGGNSCTEYLNRSVSRSTTLSERDTSDSPIVPTSMATAILNNRLILDLISWVFNRFSEHQHNIRKTEHDYKILEHWNFNCIKSNRLPRSKIQIPCQCGLPMRCPTQRTGEFNCMPIASHPKQRYIYFRLLANHYDFHNS